MAEPTVALSARISTSARATLETMVQERHTTIREVLETAIARLREAKEPQAAE
jgi:hypothetical protein